MTAAVLPAPFSLIRLDSVGSTNDEARRLASGGAALDLLIVCADTQTGGRGRRGRDWHSPAGNLHASILIRRTHPLAQSAQLGFVAAAALAEALAGLVPGVDFRCKWPNDVLADGAKVAGMLLEAADDPWLVLGLGVNIRHRPDPGATLYRAEALAHLGWAGDAMGVLAAFCPPFLDCLGQWRSSGFEPVRRRWLDRAKGIGQPMVVRLERETMTGRFQGLDADGALVLDQGGGEPRRILAGDVFFPG